MEVIKKESEVMDNPFTLTFGKEPASFISRDFEIAGIIEGFWQEHPDNQVVMLTGVRGSGKTVTLTTLSNEFRKMKDWIVVELNPERDMLLFFIVQLKINR